ncbi:MAG: hypothetical protein ACM3S1_02810, partial [Hyphomicrobiales bacterium]
GIFERVGEPESELARTVAALREAAAAGERSWYPVRPGRTAPEEWTLRKAFRRIVSHHHAHTAEIAELAALRASSRGAG